MKSISRWGRFCAVTLVAAWAGTLAGCEDDDGGEGAETTAIVNTNATEFANQNDDETAPVATTPAATSVLFDKTRRILGESSFTVQTAETPAAGTVRIEASWTATDQLAGYAEIDVPLEFTVNEGVAGAGAFHNAGHNSPFSGSVSMPANTACRIQVENNVNDCISEIRLRAIFTAD